MRSRFSIQFDFGQFCGCFAKKKTKRVILSAMRGVIRGKGFSLISHDERK